MSRSTRLLFPHSLPLVPPPKPIVDPSAPPRIVVEAATAPRGLNGRHNNDDDEGSESGASFQSARESFTPPSSPAPAAMPRGDVSDVSTSTASSGARATAGTTHRKSVRIVLPLPTPPALDEDEAWEHSGRSWGVVRNRRANAGAGGEEQEPDFCVDASDSDEECAIAQNRKWLTRVRKGKQRW